MLPADVYDCAEPGSCPSFFNGFYPRKDQGKTPVPFSTKGLWIAVDMCMDE
jgi:hypothetical protein